MFNPAPGTAAMSKTPPGGWSVGVTTDDIRTAKNVIGKVFGRKKDKQLPRSAQQPTSAQSLPPAFYGQ